MTNLNCLDIRECHQLQFMPAQMGQLTCLKTLSIFIVGKENGCGIEELKELNLRGELSIKKLDYVKGCRDAKNAHLMRKKDLKALSLEWSGKEEDNSNLSEEVLNSLQPNSNLRMLSIIGYRGSSFPNWVMDLVLPNLVEVKLEDCGMCKQLPPLGKLKFLRNLTLEGMSGVKCIIGNEIYGNGESAFPSLGNLTLRFMNGLEEWAISTVCGTVLFPLLSTLRIYGCRRMGELPIMPSMKLLVVVDASEMLVRSIEKLSFITVLFMRTNSKMRDLPDGLLRRHTLLKDLRLCGLSLDSLSNQLENLSSLKQLSLDGCELESLPEVIWSLNLLESLHIRDSGIKYFPPINERSGLSSLRRLSIEYCREFAFVSEGLRNLRALEDLFIDGSPELNSLPESIGHLTALRELRIWQCEGLSSLPNQIGNLISLSLLNISRCPNLKCLPEGIRDLRNLRELRIWNCEGLSSLPKQIGNLISLSVLDIYGCPNLKCLPEGIRDLKNLRELKIVDCPDLQRRCRRKRGEDWPKIAHIPVISFDD